MRWWGGEGIIRRDLRGGCRDAESGECGGGRSPTRRRVVLRAEWCGRVGGRRAPVEGYYR